jgi:hypothetical protein
MGLASEYLVDSVNRSARAGFTDSDADHAIQECVSVLRLRRLLEGIGLDHRTNACQFGEPERVFGIMVP